MEGLVSDDYSVRLLSHELENLDYRLPYQAYSAKGKNPADSFDTGKCRIFLVEIEQRYHLVVSNDDFATPPSIYYYASGNSLSFITSIELLFHFSILFVILKVCSYTSSGTTIANTIYGIRFNVSEKLFFNFSICSLQRSIRPEVIPFLIYFIS